MSSDTSDADLSAWRVAAGWAPVLWLWLFYDYWTTGCVSGGAYAGEMCGPFAVWGLSFFFLILLLFPAIYFYKVRKKSKKANNT